MSCCSRLKYLFFDGEEEAVPLLLDASGMLNTVVVVGFFEVGWRAGVPGLVLVGGPGPAPDLVVIRRPALRTRPVKTGQAR